MLPKSAIQRIKFQRKKSPGLSSLLCPTWRNQTSTEQIYYDIILLWTYFLREWWSQYPKGEVHASPLQHSSEVTRGEVSFYPSVLWVVLCILAFPTAYWPSWVPSYPVLCLYFVFPHCPWTVFRLTELDLQIWGTALAMSLAVEEIKNSRGNWLWQVLQKVCFDFLMAEKMPGGVTNVIGVQWYNIPAALKSLLC